MGGGKWKSGKVATLGLRPSVCCCLSVCHLALIINNIINHLQQLRLSVLVSMISRRVLNALEINICYKIIFQYTILNSTKYQLKTFSKGLLCTISRLKNICQNNITLFVLFLCRKIFILIIKYFVLHIHLKSKWFTDRT